MTATLELNRLMPTYTRHSVAFVKGEGALLWDENGRQYLDFLSGIAVCGLGHCHPAVTKAIQKQAADLLHVSNLFQQPLQTQLASKLCATTGMSNAFFCNSGAEANEAAIKLARKWGHVNKGPGCHQIVVLEGSFHGRTLGALAATGQRKLQENFGPLPEGFVTIPHNSIVALKAAVGPQTCAVMLEPIQGEGGVHVLESEFLEAVQVACKEHDVLLIVDEVQTGIGRTGAFLASQVLGVKPDVVTLAKALGNGVPIGACLASGSAAETFQPGDHGCTFGGNPLACAAALAVLDTLDQQDLVHQAQRLGKRLYNLLHLIAFDNPATVAEVRGLGLMLGLELKGPIAKQVAKDLLQRGLVVGTSGESVIRLLPPLIVTHEQCEQAADTLALVLSEVKNP